MAGLTKAAPHLYDNPYRADFPAMAATMNGRPLVYLDSGSSAQKPQVVLDAMLSAMKDNYANIHRGLYNYSQVKTEQFEAVRGKVARFPTQCPIRKRDCFFGIRLKQLTWFLKVLAVSI